MKGTIVEEGKLYSISEYTPTLERNLNRYYNHDFTNSQFNYFEDNFSKIFKAQNDGIIGDNFLDNAEELFGPSVPPRVEQITNKTVLKSGFYYEFTKNSRSAMFKGPYSDPTEMLTHDLAIKSGNGIVGSPIELETQDITGIVFKYIGDNGIDLSERDLREVNSSFRRVVFEALEVEYPIPPLVENIDYGMEVVKDNYYMFSNENMYGEARDGIRINFTSYLDVDYTNLIYKANDTFDFGGAANSKFGGDFDDSNNNIGRYDILNKNRNAKDKFTKMSWGQEWPASLSYYTYGEWKVGDTVYVGQKTPLPIYDEYLEIGSKINRWSDLIDITETFTITKDHTFSRGENIWLYLGFMENVDSGSSNKVISRWIYNYDESHDSVSYRSDTDLQILLDKESTVNSEHTFKLNDYTPIIISLLAGGGAGGGKVGAGGGGGAAFHGKLVLPPGIYAIKQGSGGEPSNIKGGNGNKSYLYDVSNGDYLITCTEGEGGDGGNNGYSYDSYLDREYPIDEQGGNGGVVSGTIFNSGSTFSQNGGKIIGEVLKLENAKGGNSKGIVPFHNDAAKAFKNNTQQMSVGIRNRVHEMPVSEFPNIITDNWKLADNSLFSYSNSWQIPYEILDLTWGGEETNSSPGDGKGGSGEFGIYEYDEETSTWIVRDLTSDYIDSYTITNIDAWNNRPWGATTIETYLSWTNNSNRWRDYVKNTYARDFYSNKFEAHKYLWEKSYDVFAFELSADTYPWGKESPNYVSSNSTANGTNGARQKHEMRNPTTRVDSMKAWLASGKGVCGGGGGAMHWHLNFKNNAVVQHFPGRGRNGGGRSDSNFCTKEMLRTDAFNKWVTWGRDHYDQTILDADKFSWEGWRKLTSLDNGGIGYSSRKYTGKDPDNPNRVLDINTRIPTYTIEANEGGAVGEDGYWGAGGGGGGVDSNGGKGGMGYVNVIISSLPSNLPLEE